MAVTGRCLDSLSESLISKPGRWLSLSLVLYLLPLVWFTYMEYRHENTLDSNHVWVDLFLIVGLMTSFALTTSTLFREREARTRQILKEEQNRRDIARLASATRDLQRIVGTGKR